jgi:alpha-D-ribose 1-methylphosphonate 5-triphosphate synthase subunit PhnG
LGGNVGIGTSAPTDKLTVNGTAGYNAITNMGTSDTDFASKKYVDDNAGSSKWTATGNNIFNANSGTVLIQGDAKINGNTFINTNIIGTSNTVRIHSDNTYGPAWLQYQNTATTTNAILDIKTTNSGSRISSRGIYPLALNGNGKTVVVGTDGNYQMAVGTNEIALYSAKSFYVNGNMYRTGSNNTISDRRYKTDINELDNALGLISQFNGYRYHYKTKAFPDLNLEKRTQIGYIAQELQKVLPEVVSEDDKGFLMVDYSKVTPVLLMAIKEQQVMIEAQNAEIESLKAAVLSVKTSATETDKKLAVLEAKLNALLD